MGFDPRLQFVHEDDGVEALRMATVGSATGIVNVAGDGCITVNQAVRLAGRPAAPVPPPLVRIVGQAARRSGLADFSPEQIRFLSYGRGLDTTRMRRVLGFEPRYTTREAFADFVRGRRLAGPLSPDRVEAVENGLRDLVHKVATGVH